MFKQLLQAFSFLSSLALQLTGLNSTPIGNSVTVEFDAGHLLEVSENGEHWIVTSVTAQRVK